MWRGVAAGALVAAVAGGCAFDTVTLPAGKPAVVVHGVLIPGVVDQVILLERSLGGAPLLPRTAGDSLDPIVADGGTPIRQARVVVTDAVRGDSVVLVEDRTWRPDGKGSGVYRFRSWMPLVPAPDPVPAFLLTAGRRYTLRVRTVEGEVVTGSTVIPQLASAGGLDGGIPRQFDRDRDSLFVGWPAVARAARYEVRIESPAGAYQAFVDSLEYLVAGALAHPQLAGRPRVFWPGFRQRITVSAVDTNLFDYYRRGSDPVTQRGLLQALSGGLGVFGSLVRVRERTVDVIGVGGAPPAGTWTAEGAVPAGVPAQLRLWPESEAPGAQRLSGTVQSPCLSCPPQGVVLTQAGAAAVLVVLRGQSLRDTAVTVEGRLETVADAPRFVGAVRGGGAAVRYTIR
jgi:hypothetical protein